MDPLLQSLLSLLKLSPTTSLVEALIKVFDHTKEALTLSEFQVVVPGAPTAEPQKFPQGATVHACSGGEGEPVWPLVNPWIGINGDLKIGPSNYSFQCRRYAKETDRCNSFATINGNTVPNGLVLHLDKAGLGPGLGEQLTLAYIFHAVPAWPGNPGSPEIWLLSTVDIGILSDRLAQ